MGKVLSMVANPFRNFNLESRAHKVISQAKPTPAPRHKKDQIDIDRLMKEYPGAYEESLKKDEQLDRHLKDVFVTSRDVTPVTVQSPDPGRLLPSDRRSVGQYLYGVKDPDHVPLGKVTLKTALEFITRHQNEPRTYGSKKISEEFSIAEETIKNILKYYKVFEIYVPQERKTKARFAGPATPKVEVLKQLRKELPLPSDTKKKT
ncbi:hypothetical protein NQ318_002712 [Aromia moschata]|uniref:Protein NDUFAF4 homolog n=1 Tax=Aromia moschata TaxID=1265417 RepID=A0AAV8Y311_9CUCU|nr:hypothetical protein NQ318_002712 [Aromia moschata]